MLDEASGVGGHVGYLVGRGRRRGAAAAPVIEGDDAVPGCGQVGYLREPQVGGLAGAADEQDRRTFAGDGVVDADSVDECVRHGHSIRCPGGRNIARMGDHITAWLETAAASSARVRTPSFRRALDT